MNKYLVQQIIETGLSSNIGDWNFKFNETAVKFLFSTKKKGKLLVQMILKARNYKDAYAKAHDDILTIVLDVISFIMKSSLTVLEIDHVLKAEKGSSKRIIYSPIIIEEPFTLSLENKHKEEILGILITKHRNLKKQYWLSLRWLRFGYRARTVLERFTYYWLAFERMIGETQIDKKCPKCGYSISHPGISKATAKKLLNRYGIINEKDFENIWKLRQRVFHGGKKLDQQYLRSLFEATNTLGATIETALFEQIKPKIKETSEYPSTAIYREVIDNHYKFSTNFPELEFAPDYPRNTQIKQCHQNSGLFAKFGLQILTEKEVENW